MAQKSVQDHHTGSTHNTNNNNNNTTINSQKAHLKVSVAIPESSLSDESLKSAKTRKASVIARACAIFGVNTIYIYGEGRAGGGRGSGYGRAGKHKTKDRNGRPKAHAARHSDADLLMTALRYLETPQFLRKRLFPHLNDLKFAGMMLPLMIPSHMVGRHPEKGQVREGVIISAKGDRFVDIGTSRLLRYTGTADPGRRITVTIKSTEPNITYAETDKSHIQQYWGYKVKHRASLPSLLSEWRGVGGQTVITSRQGKAACIKESGQDGRHAGANAITGENDNGGSTDASRLANAPRSRILRDASDMLVVFGSPERGVHEILGGNISAISDARVLDFFPGQQTATVRLEEAMTGVLAMVNAEIHRNVQVHSYRGPSMKKK